jgi:aldehyde dehydrogenase (NAD+)
MTDTTLFYINGKWTPPATPNPHAVENPATEQVIARISLGSQVDVDRAVAAARAAFESFSQTTVAERIALLERIVAEFNRRAPDLAAAVTAEMGAPAWLARDAQVPLCAVHFTQAIEALKTYAFERPFGTTLVRREPVGVCALITPWNWPLHQIGCKVAAALAAGCTMVLKPSEIAPLNAYLFAEVIDAAGVPPGVFNLVNGDGPTVGTRAERAPRMSTWCRSPAPPAPASRWRATRPLTVKRVARNSAASRPTSCSTMRTSQTFVPAACRPAS